MNVLNDYLSQAQENILAIRAMQYHAEWSLYFDNFIK